MHQRPKRVYFPIDLGKGKYDTVAKNYGSLQIFNKLGFFVKNSDIKMGRSQFILWAFPYFRIPTWDKHIGKLEIGRRSKNNKILFPLSLFHICAKKFSHCGFVFRQNKQ